jgi:hypothetical protein
MMAKKSRSESIKFENYKRLNGIESLVVLVLHKSSLAESKERQSERDL